MKKLETIFLLFVLCSCYSFIWRSTCLKKDKTAHKIAKVIGTRSHGYSLRVSQILAVGSQSIQKRIISERKRGRFLPRIGIGAQKKIKNDK